jgi:hypothetical protein
MNPLPFTLHKVYAGLAKCEGLLRDDGTHLCVEYQVKDGVAGILKSGVKTVRIPLTDLTSVTLKKGWLGTKWLGVTIVIQGSRMDAFEGMPGATQGRIELIIARKDCDAAEKLVAGLYEDEGTAI